MTLLKNLWKPAELMLKTKRIISTGKDISICWIEQQLEVYLSSLVRHQHVILDFKRGSINQNFESFFSKT